MKKTFTGKLMALFMMLCVICIGTTVWAAPPATDEDTSGSIYIEGSDELSGILLGVYEVGYRNDQGDFELNEEYKASGADVSNLKTASQAEAAAQALAGAVDLEHPLDAESFNEYGDAVFHGLSIMEKLYLVCQIKPSDNYAVSPVLATIPDYKEGIVYEYITIEAKYESILPSVPYGAIILTKVDKEGLPLSGAEFSFERKHYLEGEEASQIGEQATIDEYGVYFWEMISEKLVTNEFGQITCDGLPLSLYRFTEKKAPEGYQIDSTPILVDVKEGGTIRLERGKYVPDEGTVEQITVTNEKEKKESVPPTPQTSKEPTPERSEYPKPSEPTSVPTPQPSTPPVLTGEDIAKFIIIGVVVGVSLIAVILLFVLGRKKKNGSDDE